MGDVGRSLFDVEIGDRVCGWSGCDRCLMWEIGDRVLIINLANLLKIDQVYQYQHQLTSQQS